MADVSGFVPQPSGPPKELRDELPGPDLESFVSSMAAARDVVRVFGDLEQSEQEITSRL